MAALICKACYLPCQACGECARESCKCLSEACSCVGAACQPVADLLCNPEHPFSSCFCMTVLAMLAPAVATIGIGAVALGSLGAACSASNLPVYALVHVPILVGHALFAYYMNTQFVQVDRGRAVIKKFWDMFCWDPAVLVYILFLVFNIVWLAFTDDALSAARADGCCTAAPALCAVARACFVIEILFLVLAPFMLALSLLGECCAAEEGARKEEARRRQEAKYAQRGGSSAPLGVRVLSALPLVGGFFNASAPRPATEASRPQRAGYGYASASDRAAVLPHAQAVPVRPTLEPMDRPLAGTQPPACRTDARYSPPRPTAHAYAQPVRAHAESGASSAQLPPYAPSAPHEQQNGSHHGEFAAEPALPPQYAAAGARSGRAGRRRVRLGRAAARSIAAR